MSADRPTVPASADATSTVLNPTGQNGYDGDALVPQSVWQGAFVQNVLPFLTSLGVHATLVILGILTYQAFAVVAGPPLQEQAITPDAGVAASLAGIADAQLGIPD